MLGSLARYTTDVASGVTAMASVGALHHFTRPGMLKECTKYYDQFTAENMGIVGRQVNAVLNGTCPAEKWPFQRLDRCNFDNFDKYNHYILPVLLHRAIVKPVCSKLFSSSEDNLNLITHLIIPVVLTEKLCASMGEQFTSYYEVGACLIAARLVEKIASRLFSTKESQE